MARLVGDLFGRRSAVLSDDFRYRYSLTRTLGDVSQWACFVMLNPSTADADTDDPTIRKCIGFARRWGCARVEVVNLFAYRATDPRALLDAADPVGPDNDAAIHQAVAGAGTLVCAWGAHVASTLGDVGRERVRVVRRLILDARGPLHALCLGRCADGSPRHPLMLPYATALEPLT